MAKAGGLTAASDLLCSGQHGHHTKVLSKMVQAGKGVLSLSLSCFCSQLGEGYWEGRSGFNQNWTILESEINATEPKHGNSCSLLFGVAG